MIDRNYGQHAARIWQRRERLLNKRRRFTKPAAKPQSHRDQQVGGILPPSDVNVVNVMNVKGRPPIQPQGSIPPPGG
jgi:hypothetical protein